MRFKSDSQRRACFANMGRMSRFADAPFDPKKALELLDAGMMDPHTLTDEQKAQVEVVQAETRIAGRKALKALNERIERGDTYKPKDLWSRSKFALQNDKNIITSEDVPSVKFRYINEANMTDEGASDLSKAVKNIDDKHLGGLAYLAVVPVGHESLNKKFQHGFYKVRDRNGMIGVVDPSVDDKKTEDVIAHEVGHHILRENLGTTYLRGIGKYGREVLADEYMSNVTGAKNRFMHPDDEVPASTVLAYAETLQELKNPSVGELSKYVDDNRFSFWNRKNKGWYPADSKLPDEFPTVVRNVAFEVLGKDHTLITPDDDAQLTKLTGEVCSELDKVWKPEWGARPSGHYLRADVKDAWEDLD
jgi:hypothetical protein